MLYAAGTKVFGDWEIKKEIGEGSYGKVFEICKTDYGITTQSALKVIRIPRSPADIRSALSDGMNEASVTSYFQGFVEEIVQEIAVMSSLESHPNVVGYKDHCVLSHNGEIGWDILIRMELLTPLIEYIVSHPLNETDVIQMAEGLCSALVLCQKKGLIHRDIKPENIFVSETGQFKLGDFGVARTIEKTTGGLSKKGTESYMAPEIYLNKPYGSSVDIYSLGLVLYKFMNNNRLPFFPSYPQPITFADRENALSRRMKGDTPSAPANACKEFSDIILKACAYKPEERYRTAADMLEDIRRLRIHLATAAEAEALSNKQADPIPPTEADILPGQTESAAQTQGIFDVVSPEETIGLWDVGTSENEIDITSEDIQPLLDEPTAAAEEKTTSDTLIQENIKIPNDSTPAKRPPKKPLLCGIIAVFLIVITFAGITLYLHTKREQDYCSHIQNIYSLLCADKFDDAINYCIENEETLKLHSNGWYQNEKLFFSEDYNNSIPILYFENNPDKNSFDIYKGFYDSQGNRNGDGKELCIYYTSGNYYYSSGEWISGILSAGFAVNRNLSHDNYIFIRSGNINANVYEDSITLTTIYPNGTRDEQQIQGGKNYRLEN